MIPEVTDPDGWAAFEAMTNTEDTWDLRRREFFDKQIRSAQAAVDFIWSTNEVGVDRPVVDELAIMVVDEHQEYHVIEQAVRLGGWEMFNAAPDAVDTYPLPSSYKVHYTFLRRYGTPYRLEVMRLESGVSPLHSVLNTQAFDREWRTPIVVHASFKVPSITALGEVETLLTDNGFLLAQGCRSTYGAFAYYAPTVDNATDLQVYLKPRVNLRDQA